MTISESELKALHQLVTQDVAQIMAQFGCAHGLSVASEDLLPGIKNMAQPSPEKELTDDQLTDVTGGKKTFIPVPERTKLSLLLPPLFDSPKLSVGAWAIPGPLP